VGSPSVRVELTPDGGRTAFSERYGEHFHNRNGALTQAQRIFLEASHTDRHPAPRVLEIGFGLGVNFLTTLASTSSRRVALDYRAFEIDPQPRELLESVGRDLPAAAHPLWTRLLSAWPEARALELDGQRIDVAIADASAAELPSQWASAIYLDGFSPTVNAELWSEAFIARLAHTLAPGGWIVTYSAAGAVRRALAAAGLQVEREPGVAGKRESLRAQKR
jgi:tRNA U34 5-methylaminomethyl-2-thiouridine-forming methyltransferase MnmC